jgi:hypothetical protein
MSSKRKNANLACSRWRHGGRSRHVVDSNNPPTKSPVFGLISLLLPLFGIPLAFVLAKSPNSSASGFGWGPGVLVLLIGFFGSALLGVVAALIAVGRSERCRVLQLLGLLLNLGFLFFMFGVSH